MKKHKRPVLVGCSILLVLLLAGCSASATSPTIPKVEDSLMVSSNELLSLIRQGTIQENGDYTVEKYVEAKAKELGTAVKVAEYVRFEKGEGIQKREDNFADEVAGMIK